MAGWLGGWVAGRLEPPPPPPPAPSPPLTGTRPVCMGRQVHTLSLSQAPHALPFIVSL